jgi:hypothetical protein
MAALFLQLDYRVTRVIDEKYKGAAISGVLHARSGEIVMNTGARSPPTGKLGRNQNISPFRQASDWGNKKEPGKPTAIAIVGESNYGERYCHKQWAKGNTASPWVETEVFGFVQKLPNHGMCEFGE